MKLLLVVGLVSLTPWPRHVAEGEVTHEGPRFTRLAQEEDVIGLDIVATPVCPSDEQCDEADYTELVDALENDGQVTVVGDVELGRLLCDSLDGAESMSRARFVISRTETVVAERTSFTVVSGDIFSSDSGDRKVWIGEVVDPAPSDGFLPRTVTMTWGEECDIQTFSLQVVDRTTNGAVSIVKSVPCDAGSSDLTCIVEIEVEYNDESEPVFVEPEEAASPEFRQLRASDITAATEGFDVSDKAADIRLLNEYLSASDEDKESFHAQGFQRLDEDVVLMPSGRRLTCGTQFDILVLYTPEAMNELAITTAAQMETKIIEAFVTTNAALSNSDIPLEINVVHVGELPYDQSDTTSVSLTELLGSTDVDTLRATHGADVVQVVGSWAGTCGRGYLFNGSGRFALSLVDAGCFDNLSHTHEVGHNMGCWHNREASGTQTTFSHGHRYCTGQDPYRTVMSYQCSNDLSVPRVNYFSNPDVFYLNKATGTSTEDNALTIKTNMLTIANFYAQTGCTINGGVCTVAADCCVGTCSDGGLCEAVGCNGDPHLVGFRGQKFDFTGEDGLWFALVSDGPCHQINIRITAPVPGVPKITYITGVALSLCDVEGNSHTIEIKVKEPHVLETSCPTQGPCLADGALQLVLDGEDMVQSGQVDLGDGIGFSAVNLPGACRSFGFENYWLAKSNQSSRRLAAVEPVTAVPMADWILSDLLQTNAQECHEYVEQASHSDTLYSHQSEHTSMQITSPQLSLRISHGKVHQHRMRDPTNTFDLPDHFAFQMNLVFEDARLGSDPQGLVGETVIPVIGADGQPIMQGLGAIRGGENDYLVSGPFGHDFAQLHSGQV